MKFKGSEVLYNVNPVVVPPPPVPIVLTYELNNRTPFWTTDNGNAFWHNTMHQWVLTPDTQISLSAGSWVNDYKVSSMSIVNPNGAWTSISGSVIYTDATSVSFGNTNTDRITFALNPDKTISKLTLTSPSLNDTITIETIEARKDGVTGWIDSLIPSIVLWQPTNPGTEVVDGWSISHKYRSGGYSLNTATKNYNDTGKPIVAQRLTITDLPVGVEFDGDYTYPPSSPYMEGGLNVTTYCWRMSQWNNPFFFNYERLDATTVRFTYNFEYSVNVIYSGNVFPTNLALSEVRLNSTFNVLYPTTNGWGRILKYEYKVKA